MPDISLERLDELQRAEHRLAGLEGGIYETILTEELAGLRRAEKELAALKPLLGRAEEFFIRAQNHWEDDGPGQGDSLGLYGGNVMYSGGVCREFVASWLADELALSIQQDTDRSAAIHMAARGTE